MRSLFVILFSLALVCSASAQRYTPVTAVSYIGTRTNCAGSAATNIATVIDVRKQKDVNLQFTTRNDAAGTANLGVYIRRSVDGTTFDTTTAQYITWAANGTSDATITTNINSYGAGYIQISALTNAAAATVNTTNLTIKWGAKLGAP